MLTVRVELNSAITGQTSEIAQVIIFNDTTGDRQIGNYKCVSFRGRDKETLDKHRAVRKGEVKNHPRQREHVLNLVAKALSSMGYGAAPATDEAEHD